ncbi:MAG TPA: glycosyltransferase family 39 protein [Gemmatimonadaceae bacterium]|nr:glycosyltransferase family 39 protein [Gemmatimonadaceae bacterium]
MTARAESEPGRHRAAILLTAVALTALALRLLAAWHANAHLPDDPSRLTGDETNYDGLAYALLQGAFFTWPGRAPLYPALLAGGYLAWDYSFAAVLYAQAVLATAVVPLTYLLARRCTLRRAVALGAAAIVAVHPALIRQVTRIDAAVLFTPLLLFTVLLLERALRRERAERAHVAAGAALGLAALCQPTVLFLPLALPFALPRTRTRRARWRAWGAITGVMLLTIAPWSWHNWRTYHRVLPVSVSIAALWRGSPEFDALTRKGETIVDVFATALNPARNGGHDPFTVDGDRWFTARGWHSIRAHPLAYAGYVARKPVYFWMGNRAGDWPGNRVFDVAALWRAEGAWKAVVDLAIRILPLAAVAALLVLRRRLGELRLLLVVLGYATVYHALLYAEVRASEPWHPLLAILVAAAIGELAARYAPSPAPAPRRITTYAMRRLVISDGHDTVGTSHTLPAQDPDRPPSAARS